MSKIYTTAQIVAESLRRSDGKASIPDEDFEEAVRGWVASLPQCYDCQVADWWGGSAMTNYTCQNCKSTGIWGSTATPKLCMMCSFKLFRCYRCGADRSKDL